MRGRVAHPFWLAEPFTPPIQQLLSHINYHFSELKLLKYEKYVECAIGVPITLALPAVSRICGARIVTATAIPVASNFRFAPWRVPAGGRSTGEWNVSSLRRECRAAGIPGRR